MKRLLATCDDTDIANTISRVGESEGFQVYIAESGTTFKIAFGAFSPDAIILDTLMAGGSLLDLLKYLAADGCAAHILLLDGAGSPAPTPLGPAADSLAIIGRLARPLRASELRRHLVAVKQKAP